MTPLAFRLGLTSADEEILLFLIKGPATMMDIVAGTGRHLQTVFKSLNDMKKAQIVSRHVYDKKWFITENVFREVKNEM